MPDRIGLRLGLVPGILDLVDITIDTAFARRQGTSLAARFVLECSVALLRITLAAYARLNHSVVHDRLHLSCESPAFGFG
jgi:hypothetical protein